MTQFKDEVAAARRQHHRGPVHLPGADGGGHSALSGRPCPGGRGPEAARRALPRHCPRFNKSFPDTFTLPEPFIPKMGARIMSLGNPENKMSKSDPDGCVFLMDTPEDIMRKFKRAVTDCETAVRYDREQQAGHLQPADHLLRRHRQDHGRGGGRICRARATASSSPPSARPWSS